MWHDAAGLHLHAMQKGKAMVRITLCQGLQAWDRPVSTGRKGGSYWVMELLLKLCQNWGNGPTNKAFAHRYEFHLQNPSEKLGAVAHAWTPAPAKWRQDEPWDNGWLVWLNS